MTHKSDTLQSPGEARTRQRQRRKTMYLVAAGVLGAVIGFVGTFFDLGDGSIFSGRWDGLSLPPVVAIVLAIAILVGFLILPLWGFTQIDEHQRENNLMGYTGGLAAVIAGFPLWVVLYAGGFVPPPNAFGLWLVGLLAMLGSYLYARWRPQ